MRACGGGWCPPRTPPSRSSSRAIHIGLEVLRALVRERHVEQHGLLSHLALEVVPPVVLVGIGQIVGPDVKVGAEETFVGRLAHVLFEARRTYALALGRLPVILDRDLLQKVLSLGDSARDAARRAQHRAQERYYRCSSA